MNISVDFPCQISSIKTRSACSSPMESTSASGDITDSPWRVQHENSVDREKITWRFTPDVTLVSGIPQTLRYTATAAISRGNHRSDLLMDFAGSSFPQDKYTWPTAMLGIRDVFTVSATGDDGNSVVTQRLLVAGLSGLVETWDLR